MTYARTTNVTQLVADKNRSRQSIFTDTFLGGWGLGVGGWELGFSSGGFGAWWGWDLESRCWGLGLGVLFRVLAGPNARAHYSIRNAHAR